MRIDADVVASLTVLYQPRAYLRVTPIAHRTTPLGMGFGKTRFASPTNAFKALYIAENLATALAEAIIRDRFEGATKRELTLGEVANWGVTEVAARLPLRLLDMRGDGCFLRIRPASAVSNVQAAFMDSPSTVASFAAADSFLT